MGWHFFPFTIQYIVVFLIVFTMSLYVFAKNPKNKAYQAFLGFGLCMGIWLLAVFVGRNAPSKFWAIQLYRVIGACLTLIHPFLLLTLLFIREEKNIYILTLLPAVVLSASIVALAPYKVVWTSLGWSYTLWGLMLPVSYTILTAYVLATIVVALILIKKTFLKPLQKKYFLFGVAPILYMGLLLITNYLICLNPTFFPIGGLLALIEFIIIAYAISLPTEKITIPPGKYLGILSDDWLKFLRKVREAVPGRELGEDVVRFEEALRAMGLSDVVRYEKGEMIFHVEQLAPLGVNELVDGTTNFMRKQNWALKAIKEYTNVFTNVYKTISKRDKKAADGWFNAMIRKYGGFLDRQGVLDAMPDEAEIPKIFRELKARRTYFFKEERPTKAYQKLKEALDHGFECLVISKLEPKKVEERYDVGKASIFWLTFKEAENTVNPKRFDHLKRVLSEFVESSGKTVMLLDCFDQIMLANGFEKTEGLLKEVKDLCKKNNANLLLSINPELFEEKQMAAIEKELEAAKEFL